MGCFFNFLIPFLYFGLSTFCVPIANLFPIFLNYLFRIVHNDSRQNFSIAIALY